MTYYTVLELPHRNLSLKVRPITNDIFFDICKFVHYNSDYNISKFLDESLDSLIETENAFRELTRVDKTILFLILYDQFVDSTITLNCQHKENENIRHVKVDTSILTQKVNKMSIDFFQTIAVDDIEIQISDPSDLFCATYDDIITSMIYKIISDGEEYIFNEFSRDEKDRFLNSMSSNIFSEIEDILKSNITSIDLIDIGDNFEFESLSVDYFDNSLYSLIKSLFSFDISSLYENSYVFCKAMGSTYDHFLQLTPSEFNQFINIHKYYNDKMNETQEVAF